jgi:hypothetical protein
MRNITLPVTECHTKLLESMLKSWSTVHLTDLVATGKRQAGIVK